VNGCSGGRNGGLNPPVAICTSSGLPATNLPLFPGRLRFPVQGRTPPPFPSERNRRSTITLNAKLLRDVAAGPVQCVTDRTCGPGRAGNPITGVLPPAGQASLRLGIAAGAKRGSQPPELSGSLSLLSRWSGSSGPPVFVSVQGTADGSEFAPRLPFAPSSGRIPERGSQRPLPSKARPACW